MSDLIGRYLGPLFIKETPSGAIDGSNAAFALSQSPASAGAVSLFLDGVYLVQGLHYSISDVNVTLTDAPQAGQNLQAEYTKA